MIPITLAVPVIIAVLLMISVARAPRTAEGARSTAWRIAVVALVLDLIVLLALVVFWIYVFANMHLEF